MVSERSIGCRFAFEESECTIESVLSIGDEFSGVGEVGESFVVGGGFYPGAWIYDEAKIE